jgi:hypothetical protein
VTVPPPDDRAPLGIHEILLENVVKDVLKVEDIRGITDAKELGGNLPVGTGVGRLVVGDPELNSLSLRAKS